MAQQTPNHASGSTGLAGVFHSEADARVVAEAALALGMDPANVRVDDRDDRYRAIRSTVRAQRTT